MKKNSYGYNYFFSIPIYSLENYIGFTIQNTGGWQIFSGFTFFNSNGFSHNFIFDKYFVFDNEILCGYYSASYSNRYGVYSRGYYGLNIIHYAGIKAQFGNENVKFSFIIIGTKECFCFAYSPPYYLYYGINQDPIIYPEQYISFYILGFQIFNIGLDLYLGKNKLILFTPIFLKIDLDFLIAPYPTYMPGLQFGAGISLKFNITKKGFD